MFFVVVSHCSGGSSSSSSSSSSSDDSDSTEVAALKQQVLRFLNDGLTPWVSDTTSGLTNEGEFLAEDCIFCTTTSGCAFSREDVGLISGIVPIAFNSITFEI